MGKVLVEWVCIWKFYILSISCHKLCYCNTLFLSKPLFELESVLMVCFSTIWAWIGQLICPISWHDCSNCYSSRKNLQKARIMLSSFPLVNWPKLYNRFLPNQHYLNIIVIEIINESIPLRFLKLTISAVQKNKLLREFPALLLCFVIWMLDSNCLD